MEFKFNIETTPLAGSSAGAIVFAVIASGAMTYIATIMTVAVTQILWRPRGLLVDQFDSKEDLINVAFTSSFIPGYLAPSPATMFRNRVCIDGGLTLFMPPTSATKTVFPCDN
ncbi:hypothetical protein Patl1_36875 [Pistacia atlantica]|nr:hypothetical protein Patl1_36875 [Pistacia atlantica]